jgi:hypothetical protein
MKYMPLRCVLIFDVQHTAFNLTAESRMGRDETRERSNGRMEWREGEMVVRGQGGGWKTKNPLPQLAMHLDRAHDA